MVSVSSCAREKEELTSATLDRQIVGILAALDRFILQGQEEGNDFLIRTLQKQYSRSITALERACVRRRFPPVSLSARN